MIQNKKHRDISHSNNTQPICSTIKQRKNKLMVKAENEKDRRAYLGQGIKE